MADTARMTNTVTTLEQWGERYRAEVARICMAYAWSRSLALEAAANSWESMDKLSLVLSDDPEQAAEDEVSCWSDDGE